MTLSDYVRSKLFQGNYNPPKKPKRRRKSPVKDHASLAQVLALLGKSHIANNINQLARAANTGSLPVNIETERALIDAAKDVARMRKMLIEALDLQEFT